VTRHNAPSCRAPSAAHDRAGSEGMYALAHYQMR
jgi:hypothetical protein